MSAVHLCTSPQYLNKASSLLLTPRLFTLSFSPFLFLKRKKTWGLDPHIGDPDRSTEEDGRLLPATAHFSTRHIHSLPHYKLRPVLGHFRREDFFRISVCVLARRRTREIPGQASFTVCVLARRRTRVQAFAF